MMQNSLAAGTSRASRRPVASAGLLALATLLPLGACTQARADHELTGTFHGEAVALGMGTARTYLVLENGRPLEIGIALSDQAFTGLPDDHSPGGIPMPDGHHAFEYNLAFPQENPTSFRFMGLGWNPAGHEPPGIYDLPHFDFHFYAISQAERNAIEPSDPSWAQKANRVPPPEYVPAGYVVAAPPVPGVTPADVAVPRMGVHWVDPSSPELHGQMFTHTFIYGSWDGRVTFAEPMITKAFLETKPDFRAPIAQAQQRDTAGPHPSEYRIYWDAGAREYRVALSGFAAH